MLQILLLSCSLLLTTLAQSNSSLSLTNVTQAFSQAQIVPDVLKSFAPMALANITFTNSTSMQPLNVTPGILLTQAQTAMEPSFFLISNGSSQIANRTFVLALIDPDAPTPQNTSESQFRHFLGGDFRVNATSADSTLLTNQSAALSEFFPPTPPVGSPPHRYVLLAYVQPAEFDDTVSSFVNGSTPRNNFNITTFAASLNLGDPIAGNFFFVGPDNNTVTSSMTPSATPPTTLATPTAPTAPPSSATTATGDATSSSAPDSATTAGTGANSALAEKPAIFGTIGAVGLAIFMLFVEL